MRRLGLIVIVLALLGALYYLNSGIARNSGQVQDTPTQSASKPPPPPPPAAATASASLQPEEIVGNPATAHFRVDVGWAYDNQNQSHPQALTAALGVVRQMVQANPQAAAVIVDIDVPPMDRSPIARSVTHLGVSVNGRMLPDLTGDPGEGTVIAPLLVQQLSMLMQKHP